jgi:uncharacterized protein (TIGR02646 family)
MKRLPRGSAPPVLNRFQHGRDGWADLTGDQKATIWEALEAMQLGLCAYCEGDLDVLGRHIEHLCPKGRRPQGTFDWHNLFGSCLRRDCCGHFKDNDPDAPSYDCGDLIDPAQEDPDRFFVVLSTGRISVRDGLSDRERARADMTVRALNLNLDQRSNSGRSLCAERQRALEVYLSQDPDILEGLETLSPTERAAYIQVEVAEANRSPFGSIIRHFFQMAA